MSDEKEYQKERRGCLKGWLQALGLVAAAVVVVMGVATSPMGMAKLVAPTVEDRLSAWPGEITVDRVERRGVSGLSLRGIRGSIEQGQWRGDAAAEFLEIDIDLWGSLVRGEPVITGVEAQGLEWRLDREAGAGPASADDRKVADLEGGAWRERVVEWSRFVEEGARVEVGAWSGMAMGQEVEGKGANLRWNEGMVEIVDSAEIWIGGGAMGWEVEWSEQRVVARPLGGWLEELTEGWPMDVELGGLAIGEAAIASVFQGGGVPKVDIRDLRVDSELGQGVGLSWPRSVLEVGGHGGRWRAEQGELVTAAARHKLRDTQWDYRRDAEGLTLFTEVSDGEEGSLDLEARWHRPTGLVDLNIWLHQFQWDGSMPWPFEGHPPTQGGRIDGSVEGTLDLVNRLITLDVGAEIENLGMRMPWVVGETFEIEKLILDWPMVIDAQGRSMSIAGGTVDPGTGQSPLSFNGRVVEAGEGTHAFLLSGIGETEDVAALVKAMPEALTGIIRDVGLEGGMTMGVTLEGHTADPESLMMEVDLGGAVEIEDDQMWEVRGAQLIPEGEPGEDLVLRSHDAWQALEGLPEHLPAAVLASEDAGFFDHPGIDWTGIRMAMVENIKEGGLVRGGSTITQQVAKNLFLTHDRTLSRKLQEAFLTWRVEEQLSKEEILELYLNVAEWGPEVHGVEAAAEYYFGVPPQALGVTEAVMLGAILPNPIRFGGAIKEGYLPSSRADKMSRVLENMRFVEDLSWERYGEATQALERGQVGPLELRICADDETAPEEVRPCADLEVEARQGQEVEYEADEVDADGDGDWIPLTH